MKIIETVQGAIRLVGCDSFDEDRVIQRDRQPRPSTLNPRPSLLYGSGSHSNDDKQHLCNQSNKLPSCQPSRSFEEHRHNKLSVKLNQCRNKKKKYLVGVLRG